MQGFWTEQRVTRLKYLLAEGWTYTEIGADIGATRNAIGGKVDRLGRTAEPKRQPKHKERQRQARNVPRVVNRKAAERGEDAMDDAQIIVRSKLESYIGIPFADLRQFASGLPNQCRYISSEQTAAPYFACGNETMPGDSWCEHCKGLVYSREQNISDEIRLRRAAHARRIGRNPNAIRAYPEVSTVEDEAA